MGGYKLREGERIVQKSDKAILISIGSYAGITLGSFLLTNENIVFSENDRPFSREGMLLVYTLDDIDIVDGRAQVFFKGDNSTGSFFLTIFVHGVKTVFKFDYETNVLALYENIGLALNGRAPAEPACVSPSSGITREDAVRAQQKKSLQGIVPTFFLGGEKIVEFSSESNPIMIDRPIEIRCPYCDAVVRGRRGRFVECAYCGNSVAIQEANWPQPNYSAPDIANAPQPGITPKRYAPLAASSEWNARNAFSALGGRRLHGDLIGEAANRELRAAGYDPSGKSRGEKRVTRKDARIARVTEGEGFGAHRLTVTYDRSNVTDTGNCYVVTDDRGDKCYLIKDSLVGADRKAIVVDAKTRRKVGSVKESRVVINAPMSIERVTHKVEIKINGVKWGTVSEFENRYRAGSWYECDRNGWTIEPVDVSILRGGYDLRDGDGTRLAYVARNTNIFDAVCYTIGLAENVDEVQVLLMVVAMNKCIR